MSDYQNEDYRHLFTVQDTNGRLAYVAYRAQDGLFYVVGNLGIPKTLSVLMIPDHV